MKRKSMITMLVIALMLVLSLTVLSACGKNKDDNKDDPPAKYSVTVTNGTGGGEYAEGATVKITANAPETGKEFTSWTINGVTVDDKTKAEITFTMPANAVTATANYGDVLYEFALENCTADKESAKFGEEVTFTADEIIGKRFDSWNIKGVDDLTGLDLTKSPLTITMPANDINVAAVLEDIDYTVKVNGGTADKETAHYGDTVTITANEITGAEFGRWEITGLDTSGLELSNAELTFTMPAKNVTVTAVFEYIPYTVTVVGGTAYTDGEPAGSITAEYGDYINIVAEVSTGKRFVKWTSDSADVVFDSETRATTTFEMPAKNVTVTAVFEYIPYTVTVVGGTAYTDGEPAVSITAEYGDFINIVAEVPTGKKFVKWTSDSADGVVFEDETSATTTFEMPAKNVTVTAVFEYIPYTVTVVGGTAYTDGDPAESITAEYGDFINIVAEVPTGKRFVKWTSDSADVVFDSETSDVTSFEMPAKNVTVTAVFEYIDYTVSVTGGTAQVNDGVSSASVKAHYGDSITITAAAPATGKRFTSWTLNGVTVENTSVDELTFTMPAGNVTATAVFEDIDYEVKVICDNTETKIAHYGEEVTITAKNIEGKIFVCWAFTNLDTEELDLTRAELSFTMPANNVTAKAIYEELITLTFEGTTAQSEELQYKDNGSKSFRLPLGSGQDSCTYKIELSNPAFTFKVYGSDGEVVPYDNGDGFMCIDIAREDNYTIRVVNTGSAANCTLTVTQI